MNTSLSLNDPGAAVAGTLVRAMAPARRATKSARVLSMNTNDDVPGPPRVYDGRRHVYTVLSPRAGGLMIGINLNPSRDCNFACAYCDVERDIKPQSASIDLVTLKREFKETLMDLLSGRMRAHAAYRAVPEHLLQLKLVAFSGDGEPTLCPQFAEAVEAVAHERAVGGWPFFKLALFTNTAGLDRPAVRAGLKMFTSTDEVWVKLDAGTAGYMQRVNGPEASLEMVLGRILALARTRPVVIQSLFAELDGSPPQPAEIEAYVQRLSELKDAGARIAEVQVYSASRTPANPHCRHLPLRNLSEIAQSVRAATGLKVRVY
jgi:wyosine [tRNA(Phe)-imidazoG37] synthetase (radical SAM superfamily)